MPSATNPESQNPLHIPIIDLSSPTAAHDLLSAAKDLGFIFISPTNINPSPSSISSLFTLSKSFFASPLETKEKCVVQNNHGWVSMGKERLNPSNQKKGDFKEAFNIGEFDGKTGRTQQPLVGVLEGREEVLARFMEECHVLCNWILRLLAIALEIPEGEGGAEWFSTRHDRSKGPSGCVLRLLYYPTLPPSVAYNASEDIRAGAHSDYGSITLLFRLPSQPGLEILTPEGTWATVPVDPFPSPASSSSNDSLPILVNIGDLLSYWTNGLLKSTVHRVIFPKPESGEKSGADRYSIAYFCHPEDAAELVEVPSEVVRQHGLNATKSPARGEEVLTARDHLNERLAATYGPK